MQHRLQVNRVVARELRSNRGGALDPRSPGTLGVTRFPLDHADPFPNAGNR
jgi:hypothetical protein